jgi:isopentenyl-diphosphate delta-isomerase
MYNTDGSTLVVLVDERDHEIGESEKIKAHSNGGTLHRAVSVLVFNRKGETLLQRRSDAKYHSGGLWSNTCCTHPSPGERPEDAAHRRLLEEMGFDTGLIKAFEFVYRADVGGGLTEWEYDHVFLGLFEGQVKPDASEVSDYKWVSLDQLILDAKRNPQKYTKWLLILLEEHADHIRDGVEKLLQKAPE